MSNDQEVAREIISEWRLGADRRWDSLIAAIATSLSDQRVAGEQAERERIREAVKGLRIPVTVYMPNSSAGFNIALDDVLARIDPPKKTK